MFRFSFIVLVALTISCNTLNFGEGDLTTDLEFEKAGITKVSDIDATFTLRNGTDKTKKYDFNSGCQVSFLISMNGVNRFKAEESLICTRALTSFELKSQESKTLDLPSFFDVNLERGNYTIKAYLIGYKDEVFAEETFTVN